MSSNPSNSRRSFIKKTALTSIGISIIPRHVMGKGFIPPSDKLNIAIVGAGGKGYSDMINVWNNGQSNIAKIKLLKHLIFSLKQNALKITEKC